MPQFIASLKQPLLMRTSKSSTEGMSTNSGPNGYTNRLDGYNDRDMGPVKQSAKRRTWCVAVEIEFEKQATRGEMFV